MHISFIEIHDFQTKVGIFGIFREGGGGVLLVGKHPPVPDHEPINSQKQKNHFHFVISIFQLLVLKEKGNEDGM